MEEQKISDKKIENASIKISPEKKQIVVLPSHTKSYSRTWIKSTIFEYTWEIDGFISVSNAIDALCSPLFPETAEYKIQMNDKHGTNCPSSKRTTFYLCVNKAFTGSCTTTVMFPDGKCISTRSISGCISNMTLLTEISYDSYKFLNYTDTDTLKIQCKFKIFDQLTSNTIHMNLQSYSTVFSKDMGSLENSILDESANELEDKKSINFIVGKEKYIISKKLLHATNSSYFENICLTHEGKEIDMTNELTDSELQAFQEMLIFITTGSVRSNNWANCDIKKLLTITDKYDVPILKLKCEYCLLCSITVYNAIELIQLALSSNANF